MVKVLIKKTIFDCSEGGNYFLLLSLQAEQKKIIPTFCLFPRFFFFFFFFFFLLLENKKLCSHFVILLQRDLFILSFFVLYILPFGLVRLKTFRLGHGLA